MSKNLGPRDIDNKGLRGAMSWLVPTVTASTIIAHGTGCGQGQMSQPVCGILVWLGSPVRGEHAQCGYGVAIAPGGNVWPRLWFPTNECRCVLLYASLWGAIQTSHWNVPSSPNFSVKNLGLVQPGCGATLPGVYGKSQQRWLHGNSLSEVRGPSRDCRRVEFS